jgi:hypothetical protein
MISELLDPQNAGERLSSYIDLPKRLGRPASNRTDCVACRLRLGCLEQPGGAWGCLYLPAVVVLNDETSNNNENETMFTTG